MTKLRQLTIHRRGGKRPGAGRKPRGGKALVAHATRARVTPHTPVLVTMRLRPKLPTLRHKAAAAVVRKCFHGALAREEARVVQFSIQGNHLHLMLEADGTPALSRGMQGLAVRVARNLNALWCRTGSVFADRYHAMVLASPRQVRNALRYVLNNARKHGYLSANMDPYSSGSTFDGWKDLGTSVTRSIALEPVAKARSWLLRVGWRRHGLIGVGETPGAGD